MLRYFKNIFAVRLFAVLDCSLIWYAEPEEEHTEVSIPWEVQALFADLEDIPRLFTAALSFMSQPRIVGQPRVSFENQSKPYPSWPISKKAIRMFLVQSETTLGKDVDEVYYCIKDNMAALKLADVRDLRTKSTALQVSAAFEHGFCAL